MSMLTAPQIIQQLNEAKNLAFSNKDTFPQVLRQILNFTNNPEPSIKLWCATFLKESFESDEATLGHADRVDLAIDSLDALISLSNEQDMKTFLNVVDTSIVVFKLVFKYVNDNDGCDPIWRKLNDLKMSLTSKFGNVFPLESSDSEEHDRYRNLVCKVQLIKFIVLVIDYQTKSDNSVDSFNANFIHSNHTLIKKQAIQTEALGLLDSLLSIFNYDTLVTPLINPLLVHLTVLMKRKSQFAPKILSIIEKFETNEKLQSNYQNLNEFKLSRKYVDRLIRIFITHLFKYQLIPTKYQQSLNQKLTILTERGDEIRRKNILQPSSQDANIQKKPFDGFVNGSKKLTTLDYKHLYCLTNPEDELNNFDLASLPQHTLISMTIAALNKIDSKRLNKALSIISERYSFAIQNSSQLEQDHAMREINGRKRRMDDDDDSYRKRGKHENGDEDEDDDMKQDDYDATSVYNLPPPKELSFHEKKEQINLIIQNFFKVSQMSKKEVEEVKVDLENNEGGINKELTKVAIENWGKNSWLIVLTRLATRGMKSSYEAGSVDETKNNELSDMVRTAIFDYFLENIHNRIDIIIEWLNEEWYSERVTNELKLKNDIKKKLTKEYEEGNITDLELQINKQFEDAKGSIETPTYNKWSGKVLDAIIPFLESNDRKIFIRLLSDLPLLTEDSVNRIKSLCFDPVRIKLGFLSLQFLIMYRPPVKQACLNVLTELSSSDQQDLKDEASKLLAKYK